jgi:hypothetical protein
MASVMNRLLRILIALDILLFALLTLGGARRNETISAAAWSLEQAGKWQGRLCRPVIDWLLSWLEKDHCAVSWLAENQGTELGKDKINTIKGKLMAKITLAKPTSGYNLAEINNNFTLIEQEFQNKVLYRNNPVGEANTLQTQLDANSQRIINLPTPISSHEAARLIDVQNAIAGVPTANLVLFTPIGSIAATNVQAAVAEENTERIAEDVLIRSDLGAALAGKAASGVNTDITSITGNAATASVAANAIGQGQVWANYVGSRVFSQTYTSPSRSIQVRAGWNAGSFGDALTATVGGVALYGPSTGVAGERVTIEFTVPPLTTYIVTNTGSGGSLNSWAELR